MSRYVSAVIVVLSCCLSALIFAEESSSQAVSNPFGAQVLINPSQNQILSIYNQQGAVSAQFSNKRYAILFTPGSYYLDVRVGYNTEVLGTGLSPDDVNIVGAVRTQDTPGSFDHGPGALNNFWRGVGNLSIVPTLGSITYPPGSEVNIPANQNVWAVSQAAPLRRIHIKDGDLRLFELGWSSGGFMANSKIDGAVVAGSQQQWYTRDSTWLKQWFGGAWNIVLANNQATFTAEQLSGAAWPPFTIIQQLPLIIEKPFLVYTNKSWAIMVPPAIRNPKLGVNWTNNGSRISIDNIYIASPQGKNVDDATLINQALAQGKSIILTPGEYNIYSSLQVTTANTVILGIGLPTLKTQGADSAIKVADVDGVRLAGFTVDAGQQTAAATLVEVGPTGSNLSHSDNPSALSDVYCRVGGENANQVSAKSCITINSNDVLGDNLWLWRADHDIHYPVVVPYNINPADTGIIINGDRVIMHGLAVEHFLKYQTIWNGNHGQLFFYQSELPYDVPPDWGHDGVLGFASLKVNASSNFKAYGVGVYCFFANTPTPVFSDTAIESVEAVGISFEHLFTVYLNGDANHPDIESGIKHIINNEGGAAISTQAAGLKIQTLKRWPTITVDESSTAVMLPLMP